MGSNSNSNLLIFKVIVIYCIVIDPIHVSARVSELQYEQYKLCQLKDHYIAITDQKILTYDELLIPCIKTVLPYFPYLLMWYYIIFYRDEARQRMKSLLYGDDDTYKPFNIYTSDDSLENNLIRLLQCDNETLRLSSAKLLFDLYQVYYNDTIIIVVTCFVSLHI